MFISILNFSSNRHKAMRRQCGRLLALHDMKPSAPRTGYGYPWELLLPLPHYQGNFELRDPPRGPPYLLDADQGVLKSSPMAQGQRKTILQATWGSMP